MLASNALKSSQTWHGPEGRGRTAGDSAGLGGLAGGFAKTNGVSEPAGTPEETLFGEDGAVAPRKEESGGGGMAKLDGERAKGGAEDGDGKRGETGAGETVSKKARDSSISSKRHKLKIY